MNGFKNTIINMNWYIGQEIVCIKTHPEGVVKRGQTFTIRGLRSSTCNCKGVEIDVGVVGSNIYRGLICTVCGFSYDGPPFSTWWFSETRFSPLEYNQEAIDELLAVEEPVGK